MRRVLLALAPGPDVSFRAADGTKLVGHVFGTGRKTMILGHQSQSNLCDWATYARRLARLGYTAFAIDFRGHGLSQHRQGAAENRLALDLAAAVKIMRQRGKRRFSTSRRRTTTTRGTTSRRTQRRCTRRPQRPTSDS